jgi:hypothetical protein
MSELLVPGEDRRRRKLRSVLFAVACLGLIVAGWITIKKLQGLLTLGYVDSAIFSVRAVVAGEAEFAKAHPDVGYTCTLSQLTGPSSSAWADEVIAGLLKDGRTNGFSLEINGCQTADGKKPNPTYYVIARPLRRDMPAFCSDQSGIVKFDDTGSITKCLHDGASW